MAKEWGPLDEMRAIYFDWIENPEPGGRLLNSHSLSGGERNRIFFRRDGNYKDLTLISGADFREDGRGFVLFDYDNDGWLDMGITSPNHPRFRVVRNTIGDRVEQSKNGFVEVKLVGGQNSSKPNPELSPRDAFGARLLVTIGETKRMLQHSCGEGLSGVNANRVHIGIGKAEQIDSIQVFWPSGKKTMAENIKRGERIEMLERPGS